MFVSSFRRYKNNKNSVPRYKVKKYIEKWCLVCYWDMQTHVSNILHSRKEE